MKKFLLTLVVVFSVLAVNAQGCTWGIKGGIDVTSYKVGVENMSLKINPGNKTGFYLGGVNNLKLGNEWGVQTELLYNYAGARFSVGGMAGSDDLKASYNTHTLRLPIMAKFQPVGGLSIMAGPYFAFRMGGKLKLNDGMKSAIKVTLEELAETEIPEKIVDDAIDLASNFMNDNLKRFDVGATIGVEYAFKNGIFVDTRYNISFLNKMKSKLDLSSISEEAEKVDMEEMLGIQPAIKYSSFQIGIGFRF